MEMMKKDIENMEDIKVLVDTFYHNVRENELLAPIFEGKIQDRWDKHLAKMYSFWHTVLLDGNTYRGTPFLPHIALPIDGRHFSSWMDLFISTVDDLFVGDKAEEAKQRAEKMRTMFETKLAYLKNLPSSNQFIQ